MEFNPVRRFGSQKLVPEPIWPHVGKVANQVKVFNDQMSFKPTVVEIHNTTIHVADISSEVRKPERTYRTKIPLNAPPPIQSSELRRISTQYQVGASKWTSSKNSFELLGQLLQTY
jgi:hypothetical protein